MKRMTYGIRHPKSVLAVTFCAILPVIVVAQEPALKQIAIDEAPSVVQPRATKTDPYDAVAEGNQLLKNGKPADALEKYELARQTLPEAREIAFAEGLSEYHLGDYERARNLFREAAGGKNDALADDATYSLGTTYHSDALLSKDDPKAALSNLEQAMEYYQTVLSHDPNHVAANDGYRKAGAIWRQIKQQMQQQPQQQQSSDDKNKNDDEKQENDQQQNQDQLEQQNENQQQDQKQDQENQEQQQQDSQQQQQQENDQQQESEEQEQNQEQSSSDEQKQEDEQEPQEATADQKEQVSREQAERKLREMMQAMRERKERRREPTRLVPARPVDKDW